MNRRTFGIGTMLVAVLFAGLQCSAAAPSPQGPAVVEPAAGPEEAAAMPAEESEAAAAPAGDAAPVCLPLAVCGCFDERRCVTARVQADGITVEILDGEHAGETGHLQQNCPSEGAPASDCVGYIDPAMICRRLRPAGDPAAKYLCSMDDIRINYRCGFVDGVCSAL